jgi:hypothetical protein
LDFVAVFMRAVFEDVPLVAVDVLDTVASPAFRGRGSPCSFVEGFLGNTGEYYGIDHSLLGCADGGIIFDGNQLEILLRLLPFPMAGVVVGLGVKVGISSDPGRVWAGWVMVRRWREDHIHGGRAASRGGAPIAHFGANFNFCLQPDDI